MKKRLLGNSDLNITPLGFGAWAIGGANWKFGWGAQEDKVSVAAIHRALELGINWIDTAAVYGLGHSEEVVARALKDWPGAKPYLFTKCGMVWDARREVSYSTRRDSIRVEVEASLRRLQVEAIDLYQIHWPSDDLNETLEGVGELIRLQAQGKIRWIGVSNFGFEELRLADVIADVTSLQPPYSLLRRDIESQLLPFCEEKNIGILAYSPMASGLLTGSMTRDRIAALEANDWRRKNPEFQEPKLTANLHLVERLKKVGSHHGRSAGEVAIAWTLRNPAVTGAIVGARSAEQVDGFIQAADLVLTPDDLREIFP